MFLCHPIRKLLVSIDQSSYLIYSMFSADLNSKEISIYGITSRRLRSQILIFFIFLVLFSKTATYKTRNTGTGSGMRGMRGMFTRIPGNFLEIPGNVIILTFRGMLKNIPGNVWKDSGECSKRFRGMLVKIPGNVGKGSRKYSKRLNAL